MGNQGRAPCSPPMLDKERKPSMSNWKTVCELIEIPVLGSRIVRSETEGDIAVFRNAEDEVFAVHDKCPHKGGPLSQGIVHGKSVTCPLHSWKIGLDTGEAQAPDVGCTKRYDCKVENGMVLLNV